MRFFIILLSVFFGSQSFAVTLNEALEAAYEHNLSLKAKREELKIKDEKIMEVFSKMLPKVRLSRIKRNGKYKPSDESQNTETQNIDGIYGQMTVEQNIFRGGSDVAELVAARNVIEAAREELKLEEQKTLVSAVESFLKVKGAEDKYKNAKKMENDARNYVHATEQRFRAGEVTKTDVATAKAAYARAKARKTKHWSEFISEKTRFKNTTGIEAANLVLSGGDKNLKLPLSLDETISLALKNNPNVIAIGKQKNAATATVKARMGTILLNVDLVHEVKNNRHAPSRERTRGYEHEQVTKIELTMPIFDGGARWSHIRAAKREDKRLQYQVANVNEEVTHNATAGWSSFDAAKDILKSQKDALSAAKTAYDGAVEEEKAGIRASIDVIKAHEAYFEHYEAFVDSQTQYYVSLYSLKSVLGECTAQGLNLKVPVYNPLKNYNNIKWQLISAY